MDISSMVSGTHILVADNDEDLRRILVEQLQIDDEYVVSETAEGSEAIKYVGKQYFDAIVLDLGLPDIDGREVCRVMRKNGVKSPIIIISDADTDKDTILGLESGANDYVAKPFRIGVLLARIRAQIRQHEQSEYAVFRIGHYSFRPGARLLLDNETNRTVTLTDKETAIIKFLYFSNGKVVSREVLLDEVWGYNPDMATHTLETHVYRLRQKLERDPSKSVLLVTEQNGYRLVL